MVDATMLWSSGARKEAMELLQSVWVAGSQEMREHIANVIVAGPPDKLLARLEPQERRTSRDRRIFDRIHIIKQLGDPPLGAVLEKELDRISELYPNWSAQEGEQALFSSWMESGDGVESRYSLDDLSQLPDQELVTVLLETQDKREGLLGCWRQLGADKPKKVIHTLELLAGRDAQGPIDVWKYGLWGLRDAVRDTAHRVRILKLGLAVNDRLFFSPEISSAVTDVLEAVFRSESSPTEDDTFWKLFDRTLDAIEKDPACADSPRQNSDWVSLAINRSMGRLATTFFSALFARSLKVGAGIPDDLRLRLDLLIKPDSELHRMARVIAASRLSYLFAVDANWTQQALISCFDWERDDAEAFAVWQGFSWQARIDRKLWNALKPFFLGVFQNGRVERLGKSSKALGQLLMLVGIEYGIGELQRDEVRNAIRNMSDEMRVQALSWIVSLLRTADDPNATNDVNSDVTPNADALWRDKVSPYLRAVWPLEPALRTSRTAEQFGLMALATGEQFPEAVQSLSRFFVPANASYALHLIVHSTHPEHHPRAVLDLVDKLVDRERVGLNHTDLRVIFARLRDADDQINRLAAFRTWNERLQARRN